MTKFTPEFDYKPVHMGLYNFSKIKNTIFIWVAQFNFLILYLWHYFSFTSVSFKINHTNSNGCRAT